MLLVCAGCRFSINGVEGNGTVGSDDLGVADLAMGGGDPDLATVDLSTTTSPDLTPDPCAGAPALGANNVAAQCVIGNPPTVDGDLADWPPLTQFLPLTHDSAAQANGSWDTGVANDTNSSARYFVRWDLTYLYVAIAIADDVRQTPNTGTTSLSNNDAIEIFVDGLHNRSTTYAAGDDWQFVYSADTQKVAAQGNVVPWPAGTHEARGGASPAWTLEAAIPWTLLGSPPASPGRVVGFDLKLDDNDGDNGTTRDRDLILFYNPGNGDGSCSAPNCRTDAFGAVQLQGR
jgi:hypothetical protein